MCLYSLITSSASDRFDNKTCFLFNECLEELPVFPRLTNPLRSQGFVGHSSIFSPGQLFSSEQSYGWAWKQSYVRLLTNAQENANRKGWVTPHAEAIMPKHLNACIWKKSIHLSSLDKKSLLFLLIQKNPHEFELTSFHAYPWREPSWGPWSHLLWSGSVHCVAFWCWRPLLGLLSAGGDVCAWEPGEWVDATPGWFPASAVRVVLLWPQLNQLSHPQLLAQQSRGAGVKWR